METPASIVLAVELIAAEVGTAKTFHLARSAMQVSNDPKMRKILAQVMDFMQHPTFQYAKRVDTEFNACVTRLRARRRAVEAFMSEADRDEMRHVCTASNFTPSLISKGLKSLRPTLTELERLEIARILAEQL